MLEQQNMPFGYTQKMPCSLQLMLEQQQTLLNSYNSFSIILFISIVITFLFKYFFSNKPKTLKKFPPSPPKLPIIGNLHQFGTLPHRSLQKLSEQYGPIMLLSLGNTPTLVISSPDGAQEIMKTHDVIFANRPESNIYKKLLYNMQDVSTAPYGEYWRQLKSICTVHLLSKKRVQSFRSIRDEEISTMINRIKDQSCSFTKPVNLSEEFASLTIGVLSRAGLGRKYDDGKNGNFRRLMKELFELLGTGNIEDFLPWLAWINKLNGKNAMANRVAKECDEFLEKVVKEHVDRLAGESTSRENGEKVDKEIGEDFVDILVKIHKDKEASITLGTDNMKAIILDMFGAGTDTTSAVLDWSMAELLKNPRIMKKLQDDVRDHTKGKTCVDEDDLEKMHYLKALVKETLRYHPPGPTLVPRKSSQDAKVMGYDIPGKSLVIINAWAIARDPALWNNPEEFKPERFLNSGIEPKEHDFKFVPFGYGRRGCPGIAFGMAVVELALANIVHQFNWELPFGIKGEDVDMTECTGLISARKAPLSAVPTPYKIAK